MMSKVLGLAVLFAQLSQGQKDPINDFCRRFGHQTAVIDQRLYIDGGEVNWNPIPSNPGNYSNTWLLYHDLTTSAPQVGMPQIYANLSKNATIPAVSGGMLWEDSVNKRFYMYGGETYSMQPVSGNLYSYDVLQNNWDNFGITTSQVSSVSWGAGVGVSSLGKGFVYGGWLSNSSVPGWSGPPLATSDLLTYDMDTNKWTNFTGPDSVGRAEGVMVYVPASNDGLLVQFGGIQVDSNGSASAAPMNTVRVYDIISSKWYTQTTNGQPPEDRRRFCADVIWSQDQSSYNIYLYGGLGFGDQGPGFDDLWILSLPSFTWVNFYNSGSVNGGSPHHSLSCNIVNSGQMLVIGGTFPMSQDCDAPTQWGVHNSDISMRSGKPWNTYNPNITSYVVPPILISAIGGSSLGGATVTKPPAGFNNSDLNVYFDQKATVAVRTPTRAVTTATGNSNSSHGANIKLAGSAIAGISVGGAILISSVILGACFCIRRSRRNHIPTPPPPPFSKTLPAVPPVPFSPRTQFSRAYSQKTAYSFKAPSHYQLPAEPEPVELYGSHFRMTQHRQPEDESIRHLREVDTVDRSLSTHSSPASISHLDEEILTSEKYYESPIDTITSLKYSAQKPVALYTRTGRTSRPPENYYSP